jgi:hypothetical protein
MLLSHRLADFAANPVTTGIQSGTFSTIGYEDSTDASRDLSYPAGSQAGDICVFSAVRSSTTGLDMTGWSSAWSSQMSNQPTPVIGHFYKILSSGDIASGILPSSTNNIVRSAAVFRLSRAVTSLSMIGLNYDASSGTQSGDLTMSSALTLPCLVVANVRASANPTSPPTISNGGNSLSITNIGMAFQTVDSGGVTTARNFQSIAFGTALYYVKGIFALVAN